MASYKQTRVYGTRKGYISVVGRIAPRSPEMKSVHHARRYNLSEEQWFLTKILWSWIGSIRKHLNSLARVNTNLRGTCLTT